MATITYRDASALIEVPYVEPFIAALKARIAHGYRNYQPYNRTWTVYEPYIAEARRLCKLYYPELEEKNLEVFEDREARRQQEQEEFEERRYQSRQSYGSSGYGSSQHNPHEPPTSPYAILNVDRNAPQFLVDAAYRAHARKAHPDAGGNTTQMQKINAAYDQIKAEKGWK